MSAIVFYRLLVFFDELCVKETYQFASNTGSSHDEISNLYDSFHFLWLARNLTDEELNRVVTTDDVLMTTNLGEYLKKAKPIIWRFNEMVRLSDLQTVSFEITDAFYQEKGYCPRFFCMTQAIGFCQESVYRAHDYAPWLSNNLA